MLTFPDTDKKFEFYGDLLKMMANWNYNVDHANLSNKKIRFDCAKELYFDEKAPDNKSPRDKSLITLGKPPAIMASGKSTIFLAEKFNELCDRLNLLLQEKQAGNTSKIFNGKIGARTDKLLEYKWISTEQRKFWLLKGLH